VELRPGRHHLAILYAFFLLAKTLIFGRDVPGYASLITSVLFLGGLQLAGLGVLGEYIGRIYGEVKQRPIYVIRDLYDFPDQS
jgi:glycosyltransferase involved in cell wall biosynthesis